VIPGAADASVEELADTDPAVEASLVEGSEDATDHPVRPMHTHMEYRRAQDVAPERNQSIDPDELKHSA
jgi:hypothetical protein